jgi:hypothetical protein
MKRTCLILVIALVACAAVASAQPSLGKPFVLKVGETAIVGPEGLTVGFPRILGDSRCPLGVLCIWEGDAAGLVSAKLPSREGKEYDLHTHRSFQWKVTYHNYEVSLVNIAPYPYVDSPIPPEDYVVTLVVADVASPVDISTWGRIKALYSEEVVR